MAQDKKGRKVGRSKRNGQAARYRNERRDLQSKVNRLRAHIKRHGVHDNECLVALRTTEITLGQNPSDLKVNPSRQSSASVAWYAAHSDHAAHRKAQSLRDRAS